MEQFQAPRHPRYETTHNPFHAPTADDFRSAPVHDVKTVPHHDVRQDPEPHSGFNPGTVLVAPPVIQPQPWPTSGYLTVVWAIRLPEPEQYDNLLFTKRHNPAEAQGNRRRAAFRQNGRGQQQPQQQLVPSAPPMPQYMVVAPNGYPTYPTAPPAPYAANGYPDNHHHRGLHGSSLLGSTNLSGARLKVTRHVLLEDRKNGGSPLLDLGLGLDFSMDKQQLKPVARLKIKDWLSIKAFPFGVLKAAHCWRIPGTGMALSAHYDLPLSNIKQPWMPPSRLMVRLNSAANSGLHFSPMGVEFDHSVLALGENLQIRGAGALLFPRQLPIDPDDPEASFGWRVQRLGVKARW